MTSEPLSKERRMEAKDDPAYIVDEIHTTIVATVDDEALPVTAAIDMMESDDNSLYFLIIGASVGGPVGALVGGGIGAIAGGAVGGAIGYFCGND